MKKIVKLTESDLNRIVKKTILKESDTYKFRSDYSDNLRRIELSTTDGDRDKLEDVVDVYQTHIKFIQDWMKEEDEKEKSESDKKD